MILVSSVAPLTLPYETRTLSSQLFWMADIPLQEWPADLMHVRAKFTRLYRRNPRYEMSWFGGLASMFGFIFPPTSPRHFETHAQFILRPPVPGGLPPDDAPGPDLADPDPDPSDDEGAPEGNTSIVSQGYPVQARGQGREVIRIPDFVIDQDLQTGGRGLVLLIEVKASSTPRSQDFVRFLRYIERLQAIAEAGGFVQNITAMLIAGGRVYNWDFAHFPVDLRQGDLLQMAHIRVDSVEFLNRLGQMRDNFPQ
ncbi:hypothetical protein FRC10_010587 [Ceratobasidium sp. 414]|nr:hypothetical protein FRC10_010587 [Ceratobasidium sp. 414]